MMLDVRRACPRTPGRWDGAFRPVGWQDWVMSDENSLIVDLSRRVVESTDELWDQLAQPCGLPSWFGRNLDAWDDTLKGGVSARIDSFPMLVIKVQPLGLFAPDNDRGRTFSIICEESERAKVERIGPTDGP
jgi:hypothetical protein